MTTLQVIQRRDDYGDPRENFNRDWDDYKYGFGKPDQELWLGNENIFLLTKASEYEMRVDLEDFDGNKRYLFVYFFGLASPGSLDHILFKIKKIWTQLTSVALSLDLPNMPNSNLEAKKTNIVLRLGDMKETLEIH